MKVTLQPVSHTEISEIVIEDTLFSIGRREEPFASLQSEAVAKLSRRHARIFQEDDKVYIADLGSLNGTQVNGQDVRDKATLLQAGDEITLGGDLVFRINIEQEPEDNRDMDPTRMPRSILLVLLPTDAESALETIVISQFPFLVTRTDSVFGRYKSQYPDDVGQISRRHAVISARGENIYIEDLGSINGTFVCGEQLNEHTRLLANGDTVAFGGSRFGYTVRLEITDQEEGATGTVLAGAGTDTRTTDANEETGTEAGTEAGETVAAPDDSRTTFVNSATSFLDIFLDPGEEKDTSGEDAEPGKDDDRKTGSPAGKKRGVADELRKVLGTDSLVNSKRTRIAAGIASVVLVAAIGFFFLGNDRREIKEFLDEGDFLQSAVVANRYLENHADDEQAGDWAEEALMKAIVPTWMEMISQRDYASAEAYLLAAKEEYRSITDAQEMITILAWAGKVEAYMVDRRGNRAPIVMFRDDESIRIIAEKWNQDPLRYRSLLSRISTHVPSFADTYARILSDLRTIRSEHALYGKAVAKLKSDINQGLRNQDHESISTTLSDFGTRYPRVEGVEKLKQDADEFKILATDVQGKNLSRLTRQDRKARFQTPLFNEYVGEWLDRSLPPTDIIEEYKIAGDAWRSGELEQSIATLEPLISQPWGEVAEKQIERQNKIFRDFESLAADQAGYSDRLMAFRAELDPVEDVYFIQATNANFEVYREQILAQLDALYSDAETQWSEYRNNGKISGVMRVGDQVSGAYKKQAARLSAAYAKTTEGMQAYRLLKTDPPAARSKLANEVADEARRQREWLGDLNVVLDPVLLKSKLDLLPQLKEHKQ